MISEDEVRGAVDTIILYCREHQCPKQYDDGEVEDGCRDFPDGKPLTAPPENYEPCIFRYKDYCILDTDLYGMPKDWKED